MMHDCERCGNETSLFIESYRPLRRGDITIWEKMTIWLCADCIIDADALLERFVRKEEEE